MNPEPYELARIMQQDQQAVDTNTCTRSKITCFRVGYFCEYNSCPFGKDNCERMLSDRMPVRDFMLHRISVCRSLLNVATISTDW